MFTTFHQTQIILQLTNGGGVSESARCHKLSQQLGIKVRSAVRDYVPFTEKDSTQIDPKRYIQAHTVLKSVVHEYADLPVLVLGGKGDTLRKVAEG
jgi:ribonucleotide monophosphatase NagD (HAD superfamily)